MEANNTAAMREALTKVKEWMERRIATRGFEASATFPTMLEDVVLPVLAAPPRNCDVGTAEEQAERYGRYCDKFTRDRMHCENCPCCGKISFGKCEFAWEQMPYEGQEGGAES